MEIWARMEAFFNDKDFDTANCWKSVKNLYGRYQDIQEVFPEDITDERVWMIWNEFVV